MCPPGSQLQPWLLYEDVFNLEAVCKLAGKEVRYPLHKVPSRKHLCWEPQPGKIVEGEIPISIIMKKPAAARKDKKAVDTEVEEEEEEAAEEQEEEEAEEQEEEEAEEQEDKEEEEKEEEKAEEDEEDTHEEKFQEKAHEEERHKKQENEKRQVAKAKCQKKASMKRMRRDGGGTTEKKPSLKSLKMRRKRVVSKRPASELEPMVAATYLHQAFTGKNIRCYLLAKCGSWKSQLIQITPNESDEYHAITTTIHQEAQNLIQDGVTFNDLKSWALQRKSELTGGHHLK